MSDAPDIASLRHFSTIKNPDKNSEPMAILSKTVTVEKYLAGVRVDSFLVKHFRSYTSWRILRMVAAGLVTIDGQVAATTQRVHPGQQVTIQLAEPPDLYIPPNQPRSKSCLKTTPCSSSTSLQVSLLTRLAKSLMAH